MVPDLILIEAQRPKPYTEICIWVGNYSLLIVLWDGNMCQPVNDLPSLEELLLILLFFLSSSFGMMSFCSYGSPICVMPLLQLLYHCSWFSCCCHMIEMCQPVNDLSFGCISVVVALFFCFLWYDISSIHMSLHIHVKPLS